MLPDCTIISAETNDIKKSHNLFRNNGSRPKSANPPGLQHPIIATPRHPNQQQTTPRPHSPPRALATAQVFLAAAGSEATSR